MKKNGFIGVSVVMLAMAALIWTGCESAEGTSGIGVSPGSVTLGGTSSNGFTQVFSAQTSGNLALPLVWRVSNAELGALVSISGSNATYRANEGRHGDNVITVTDQYGNDGSAIVMQP
jgi:hypothetical protein